MKNPNCSKSEQTVELDEALSLFLDQLDTNFRLTQQLVVQFSIGFLFFHQNLHL